jgi:hypothetical protein
MTSRSATFTRAMDRVAIGFVLGFWLAPGCGLLKTENEKVPVPPAPFDSGTANSPATSGSAGAGGSISQRTGSTCCTAHETPGCSDKEIEACVCGIDSACCSGKWDIVCVEMMKLQGCGVCPGDCCKITNVPGCEDNAKVQKCVCTLAQECCTKWDSFCVLLNSSKCGICSN